MHSYTHTAVISCVNRERDEAAASKYIQFNQSFGWGEVTVDSVQGEMHGSIPKEHSLTLFSYQAVSFVACVLFVYAPL